MEGYTVQSWISGKEIDRRTGESLAGVLVRLGGEGAYTDMRGEFRVPYKRAGIRWWFRWWDIGR